MPADGPPDPEPMRDTTSEAPTETAARRRVGRAARLIAAGLVIAAGIAAAGRGARRVAARRRRRHQGRPRVRRPPARRPPHHRSAADGRRRWRGSRTVRAGLRDELESPRRLFAAIDTLLDPAADGPALTIYGATGRPLAWAGRPSELPRDRVLDGANLFVAHAALGLRLVAIEPIAESATNARRLGTVAAEARLSAPDASRQGETYVVDTAYGPVTFQRSFGDRAPDAEGFVIAGPNGAPLLEATIAPDAGAAARAVWLARVDRLALAALGARRWRSPRRSWCWSARAVRQPRGAGRRDGAGHRPRVAGLAGRDDRGDARRRPRRRRSGARSPTPPRHPPTSPRPGWRSSSA